MKRDLVLVSILVLSIMSFMGAATWAVINGSTQRENTCNAVKGLRTDIVEVLNSQRGRAEENAIKLGLSTKDLESDYDAMLKKLGDPKCP